MDDYPFKCNYMSVKEIRTITDSLRNNCCGKNDLPIDVERIIEKHFHLDIILQSGIKEATGFEAFLRSDLTGIFVDSEQYLSSEEWSSNRIRFSLAHEIGHYILHDRIYKLADFHTEEEYFCFFNNFSEKEYAAFEWQANEFAGSLLVPISRLKKEIRLVYERIKEQGLLDLLEEYQADILERVSKDVCKPFGVSRKVIERRVQVEGLWPPREPFQ